MINTVDEIIALGPMRVQKSALIFNHILVIEIFSPVAKRLYLIFDLEPQTATFHLQKEQLPGTKNKTALISLLHKYAVGQMISFYKLDENATLVKGVFTKEGLFYSLIFDQQLRRRVAFYCADKLLASSLPNDAPPYQEVRFTSLAQTSGLEQNFLQAKLYQEKLLAYHSDVIFHQELARLKRALKKKKTLQKNVEGDLDKSTRALELERTALLITAHLHLITRGMRQLDVTDYFNDPPKKTTIKLDEKLPPKDYAQLIFTKVKKARRAIAIISKRLADITQDITNAQMQIDELFQSRTKVSLSSINSAIEKASAAKKPNVRLPYKSYVSSDGINILVGKSAKDSDILTTRHAKGKEWWLHARDVKGAHVVIKTSLEVLPEATLLEAALLAQHFSKDRDNDKSIIQYTRIKYVHKKKGLAAGTVIIAQEKTIEIMLDSARLTNLLNTLVEP